MGIESEIKQKFINKCLSRDIYYEQEKEKPSVVLQGKYSHLLDDFVRLGVELNKNAEIYTKEDVENGIYGNQWEGFYKIPRTKFLLHSVNSIENKLLNYYKKHINSQGDNVSISITNTGKWKVTNVNDCPMQHGNGDSHIFTEKEFIEAMKKEL